MSCSLDFIRTLNEGWRTWADLQARIEDGHKVWAVGDIHGHLATFRALVPSSQPLKRRPNYLSRRQIDRGPDSAGLIEFIRSDERIICLKMHEQIAIRCTQEKGQIELWKPWLGVEETRLGALTSLEQKETFGKLKQDSGMT